MTHDERGLVIAEDEVDLLRLAPRIVERRGRQRWLDSRRARDHGVHETIDEPRFRRNCSG